MRRHEARCGARCPLCGAEAASRRELSAHAAAQHGRAAPPPLLCPLCFRAFASAELLSAHALRHRQAKQFVCGYGDCVLRFATRSAPLPALRLSRSGIASEATERGFACYRDERTTLATLNELSMRCRL